MNIYLSYHPVKLHSISLPMILMHNTIPLKMKYFDEFNIIDIPRKYYEIYNEFTVEKYDNFFLKYVNININLKEKNLFIGYGPWGFKVLFNENLKIDETCKRIIWQDDLHFFYKKEDINIFQDDLTSFEHPILNQCDLILSPSPIFFKNINSQYLNKTRFYFYALDNLNPYFQSLKPFQDRKNKILLSGNISHKTYPSRSYILRKMMKKNLKSNIYKRHFENLPHPNYISSGQCQIDKIHFKYYDILQEYKVVFIGFGRPPINFLLSKIIETLYCGCLALIEKTPLLKEELGLIDGVHYVGVEFTDTLLLKEKLIFEMFNSSQYQKIAEEGKKYAMKNFNLSRNAKKILNISKKII